MSLGGFDPVQAFNLILERMDQMLEIANKMIEQMERIVETHEELLVELRDD